MPDEAGLRVEVLDVFTLAERGTAVVVQVLSGRPVVGAVVQVERTGQRTRLSGVETFLPLPDPLALPVGLLVRDLAVDDVRPGDRLVDVDRGNGVRQDGEDRAQGL